MDTVEVSTVVFLPPAEVYDFLLDFPRYARYSEYLRDVRQYGDGSPGTEYELQFAWWKLSYTARSEVTDVAAPERIDWRVVKDVDAVGHWEIEDLTDPDTADAEADVDSAGDASDNAEVDVDPAGDASADAEADVDGDPGANGRDGETPVPARVGVDPPAWYEPGDPVTRVTMEVRYAPDSAGERMVDLPRFVSLDWVVDMVKPKIQSEAENVVRRIVADLEGEEREIELDIETS